MSEPVFQAITATRSRVVTTHGAFYWEKMAQRGGWTHYDHTLECGHTVTDMTFRVVGEKISCPFCKKETK